MSQYSELTKRALLSYPIVGVLSALGKRTDRPAGHGFFFSPFREERHPSFQINESANVWTDWGTGDRGGVLDLVCRLKGCSRPDAMDFLASLSPASVIDGYVSCPGHEVAAKGSITIDGIYPLEDRVLLQYMKSRGIPKALSARFCNEVRFSCRGRNGYYSVGFRNNRGGYVLRNGMEGFLSKISSAPSGITTFDSLLVRNPEPSSQDVYVLEGFMDFLSLLVMCPDPAADICVLNSGANIGSARAYLSSHDRLHLMLDNDPAGDGYTARIREMFPALRMFDCRCRYGEYNDLNDLLLGRKGVRKPLDGQGPKDSDQQTLNNNQL